MERIFEELKKPCKVKITSDSKYFIDAFLEGKTQDYLYYFVVSDFIQFRYIKNIELDDVSRII
jgi:ribonuclease HI